MSKLRDYDWHSIYESRPSEHSSHLVDNFYVPALERSVRYDRIAGYFDSGALAAAAEGIETLADNDGTMRLIVGTELRPSDRPFIEALADELGDKLEDLEDATLDDRLALLTWLLREDRIEMKIAVPHRGEWGIFHPKVGIFVDESDAVSFEGSINETAGGWTRNYERFKVHRSWVDGQDVYVEGDQQSFERLWDDNHAYVDVYDLPEALRRELIEWKAPDNEAEVQETIERLRGPEEPTDADRARILRNGAQAPGGLHLAEEASTIDPWPHQRVVSDTAVNTYPQSYLLCDEVGLGKTIEVGLTLSRLGLTGELKNTLVLTPASLTVQWQEELWEKFNINAFRYDRGEDYDYAFIDALGEEYPVPNRSDLTIDADKREEAWVSSPLWRFAHSRRDEPGQTVVLMSWHTARLTDRWDQIAPQDDGRVRTRQDIPASCRGRPQEAREGVWDAVVVDEAHNARDGSNFYQLLERLRDHTQCYYLLTATPMQLHHSELYDLMTFLDLPEEWDDEERFVEFFETRRALSTVVSQGIDLSDRATAEPAAQATIDGQFQDGIESAVSFGDVVLEGIVSELKLDDQGRGVAKQRVLETCNLARAYGREYDAYKRKVESAIEDRIDPFAANEDTKLKRLLYSEPDLNEEAIIASRNDRLDAIDELSEDGWDVLVDVLGWATPVDACIHRNTRDTLRKYRQANLLDATVPTRKPERCRIELNDETRQVYDRIDEYTRTFYKKAQQSSETETRAIGFVMTTYRQRLTSSVYAISESLSNRLEKLRQQRRVMEQRSKVRDKMDVDRQQALDALEDFDEDEIAGMEDAGEDLLSVDLTELAPSMTDEGIGLLEEEIEELESFIQEVKQIDDDPKMHRLYQDIQDLDRQGRNRIIVFTQYKDTMHFIRDELLWRQGENIACYSGDGGEMYDEDADAWRNVGKERVKREFSDNDGEVDILVCTDSASEGLNLQECGAMINYDLPWNPMRVEQRIGRIDRIGQRYDDVIILNYSYEDTVESDIYDRLDARIGLFENVVGDMQPILSGVGSQIRQATMEQGVKPGSEEYEKLESEIERDIETQESETDPVELKDSLAAFDEERPLREQVIEEARLDAWETYSHPDLGAVGNPQDGLDPIFRVESIEGVFTENEALEEIGISFEPLSDLETEFDLTELQHAKDIYCMTCPEGLPFYLDGEGDTLATQVWSQHEGIGVTFVGSMADEYPSLRFLAPGSPLFEWIAMTLEDEIAEYGLSQVEFGNDDASEIVRVSHQPSLVKGWAMEDYPEAGLSHMDSEGSIVTQNRVVDYLRQWADDFSKTRLKITTG
jgi:hypothetical protein